MAQLIVLTCASGKQCAHTIPRLIDNPAYKLRLVASRPESVEKLKQAYPEAEVVQADLAQPNDCARIVEGANVVVHIGPSFHPHETSLGYNMIDACLPSLESGNNPIHFVYSSVLHTQLRKLLNHDSKRYVEEYLIESGLPWTILGPSTFLDNFPLPLLVQQHQKCAQPVCPAVYDPDTPMSMIALSDMGDAVAKVVAEREKHVFAQYPLCSTLPITNRSLADICGKQLGTIITMNKLSRKERDEMMMARLFGDAKKAPSASRAQGSRMLMHYDEQGLQGSPNVLRWLLGREPTQPQEWMREGIKKAQSGA